MKLSDVVSAMHVSIFAQVPLLIFFGIFIGVVQEWSTLVITPSLKLAVGFVLLVFVLIVRPQGLFGAARTADR